MFIFNQLGPIEIRIWETGAPRKTSHRKILCPVWESNPQPLQSEAGVLTTLQELREKHITLVSKNTNAPQIKTKTVQRYLIISN